MTSPVAGNEGAAIPLTINAALTDPSETLTIGTVTVRFTPTRHYIPCWAIRVSGQDNRNLVYTAEVRVS